MLYPVELAALSEAAKIGRPHCPGQDLNLHEVALTSPSSWRVCQFRHPGAKQRRRRGSADVRMKA